MTVLSVTFHGDVRFPSGKTTSVEDCMRVTVQDSMADEFLAHRYGESMSKSLECLVKNMNRQAKARLACYYQKPGNAAPSITTFVVCGEAQEHYSND